MQSNENLTQAAASNLLQTSTLSNVDAQIEKPAAEEEKKEVKYCRTDIKIGRGKHHAVELIVYKNELCALKKIPKITIDKQKRIEHLKNEKKICHLLQERMPVPDYFIRLEETFMDKESINFIFEFMPGQDLYHAI